MNQPAHASETSNETTHTALFAGGCFWCIEAVFDNQPGVLEATSGYSGGDERTTPTYKNHGRLGYYEVVQVTYNPAETNYAALLNQFVRNIDPTDDGGQFADRGDSYRTAIFVETPTQRAAAEKELKAAQAELGGAPIVTKILPKATFYPAEDYHQNYADKNPARYMQYKYGSGRVHKLKELWDK